ncbi:MAG TPA: DeoR/GlpR family DNA-binding transcription regulator [Bacilli bacterium]
MLVAQRYEMIEQLVKKRGSIRVSELSELCGVTEETIRRDLDKLERLGKLRRSHGGAVSVKETAPEIPYFEREATHVAEKKEIAAEAIKRISPRDRIILDASTTAWYMAASLPDIPLTVLTNSIKVAVELAAKSNIQVISTGGFLASRSLSYVGPLAEQALDLYHVNKAFISCKGVHLERGMSESNELQATVKRKMIGIADKTFLLADFSKFGSQELAHLAGCEQISALITDRKADSGYVQALAEKFRLEVIRPLAN